MIAIYAIINISNERCYVGSTRNIDIRWRDNRRRLRKGAMKNKHLQKEWLEYGETSFRFVIVEELEDASNLLTREQFWIEKLGTYNVHSKSMNPGFLGRSHSLETKNKLSQSSSRHLKGNKIRLGKKHTSESIALMKEARTNWWKGRRK